MSNPLPLQPAFSSNRLKPCSTAGIPVSHILAGLLVLLTTYTLIRIAAYVRSDYAFFLSLGPGGTPQTPAGYTRICLLRLVSRSKRDVLIPPLPLPTSVSRPYFKSLDALPLRRHVRPFVAGLAPHRQLTQQGSAADVDALTACLKGMANANPAMLIEGKSCFEKHSLALFLAPTPQSRKAMAEHSAQFSSSQAEVCALPPKPLVHFTSASSPVSIRFETVRNATCGVPPEIAHMHGSDGSLHLTLGVEDAAVVIRRGWGERHPLAGRWVVPKGFVMVYAPRNGGELRVVREIVRAGAMWVGGVELE